MTEISLVPILTLAITILIGIVVAGATNKIIKVADKVGELSITSAVQANDIKNLQSDWHIQNKHIEDVSNNCNKHIKSHAN
jgi:hypothetical protein